MTLLAETSHYQEAFMRLIYPSYCGVCRAFLKLEEDVFCTGCQRAIEALRFSLTDAILDQKFQHVRQAWSLFPYRSPIKEILKKLKFSKKTWLLKGFQSHFEYFSLAICSHHPYDAVIPVPLSKIKQVKREFNQAELIAKLIAKVSSIPVRSHWLKKRFHGMAQSQLSRQERKMNLEGAFVVSRGYPGHLKRVLLVDDVLTTGATAEQAARSLKQAGVRHVDLLTLAHTERN